MKECLNCKGELEWKTAPMNVDRKGYHLHWNAVPAWVCVQCGEPYFESDVLDHLQKALAVLDRESEGMKAAG